MKKTTTLTLFLALLLTLNACGAQGDTAAPEADTAESALHFALGEPLIFSEEYKDDDGTLLLTVSCTLPQLELRTESGEAYELSAAANAINTQRKETAICNAFNAQMQRVLDGEKKSAEELLEAARNHHALKEAYWANYFEELTAEVSYMTDGLVSVWSSGYGYWGGAHPNSSTYCWNFDLTTGEFLTLDALNVQPSAVNDLGETLTHIVALHILDEIDAQGLAEKYYEDYYSYIFDLAANANFCFTESGMTAIFDAYVIAPYAAGAQSFDIPYHVFYNALDEHTRSLLDAPRDEAVLANYQCAQTLWSWFYLGTAPVDTGVVGVAVDDLEYYRVACGDLNSLDGLRALLREYVSAEVAEEWLGTGRFLEVNGALYALMSDGGSEVGGIGGTLGVTWAGDGSGTVVRTVPILDADGAPTGAAEVDEFPFTMVGERAVFTAFPAP